MNFENVSIAGLGYSLPPHTLTSLEIEERLAPVYDRIRLHSGRLELMTGIRERRFWDDSVRPSDVAAEAGKHAMQQAGIKASEVDLLVHASVCRNFLEPATASVVHEQLGLSPHCQMFDLSNACLGVATSMALVAQMIDSGAIRSGLIVAGEIGKPLTDTTINQLLSDQNVTRKSIKSSFASLTIGSGAAAVVLSRSSLVSDKPRLVRSIAQMATQHNHLCQGDTEGSSGLTMKTDAEALLFAGVELAKSTWRDFSDGRAYLLGPELKTVSHQVGRAHTKLLYESLALMESGGYFTYETLGNVGSVSLPITLALAAEASHIQRGDTVALLGIGSGLACQMMEVSW